MSGTPSPLCVAIDGGGTRCRLAFKHAGRVEYVEGGTANVSSDFDGSVSTILDGITQLSEQAEISVDQLSEFPAFVGVAGMTGREMAARLRSALPFKIAHYADDRPAALRGALGGTDGVIVHCGTGSFLAAQIDGNVRLAGGWGPVLGDEGSAQLLGRRLLWLALQHVDGFHPETPLIATVLKRFGDAPAIVRFAGKATPSALGALAPMVTQAARRDDAAGKLLLHEATDQISRAVRQIGWTPGLTICLTGGVAGQYAAYLPDDMRQAVKPAIAEPIQGALALAAELAVANRS